MEERGGSGKVTESGNSIRHTVITLTGNDDDFDVSSLGMGVEYKHIQRVSNLGTNSATMSVRNSKAGEPAFVAAMAINLFPGTTDIERAALARDNLMSRGTHIRFVGTAADTIDLELVFD